MKQNLTYIKIIILYITFFFQILIAQPENLYDNIIIANCTESLLKIRDASIKLYEFKYDSVEGRRHMGIIGYEAEKYFPDSIDIIPVHSIPSKDRNRSTIQIKNFPMIDKNVLFMHGFAAIKELLHSYEYLESSLENLNLLNNNQTKIIENLEKKFQYENIEQLKEIEKLIIFEKEIEQKEKDIDNYRLIEEQQKNNEMLKQEKQLFSYQEELLNNRLIREEELKKNRLEESLKFEQELNIKRELLRRETEEKLLLKKITYEKELEEQKTHFEEDKIRAEIEAKAEFERKNEDVTIRRLTLQADLETQKFIHGFNVISEQLTIFGTQLLSRPKDILIFFLIIIFIVILFQIIKEISTLLRQYLQNQIGRPSLIREMHSNYFFSFSFFQLKWIFNFWNKNDEKLNLSLMFKDVILSSEDTERVLQLALAARNTKRLGTSFRHILFYGPPGTGKTLIARRLAESSNMDYAIMSGGDIGPLGEDAVNQLHSLFRWASRSKRGLLLFIDEAEAFLGIREKNYISENIHIRNALNALLYQTGTHSKNFMLVLATNRPEELDPAILDRLDISMLIGLPKIKQRKDLFYLYLESLTKKQTFYQLSFQSIKISIDSDCLNEQNIEYMANNTEGFSGREIAKLIIAAEYHTLLSENKVLTVNLLREVLQIKISERIVKSKYLTQE